MDLPEATNEDERGVELAGESCFIVAGDIEPAAPSGAVGGERGDYERATPSDCLRRRCDVPRAVIERDGLA